MKPLLSVFLPLIILFSCQNRNGEKQTYQYTKGSTADAGIIADTLKLVKTAGIRLKVQNVEQSIKALSLLAQQKGGQVYEAAFQAAETDKKELKVSPDFLLAVTALSPQADVSIRVPAKNLEAFLFDAAELSYYTHSSHLKIDDRSLAYLQNTLKQKAREEVLAKPAIARPLINGKQQAVLLKDEAIDRLIANKTIDADVQYSTITLSLFQNTVVRKEMIANYTLSTYEPPFGNRLKNALDNGWQGFLTVLLALLQLWFFMLIGIFGFVLYKYQQSKKRLVS